MLKKILFSAAMVMPLASQSFAGSQGQQQVRAPQSIDELRALCQGLERNEQIALFNKGLICKGSLTRWQERRSHVVLPNQGTLDAVTSYVKRDQPISTPGIHIDFEGERDAAVCHVYDKYRIQAPLTPVYVNSCEELTSENVEALCRDAIEDQCGGANDPLQHGQQEHQQNGACTVTQIGHFNSCDLYGRNPHQQGPVQQK